MKYIYIFALLLLSFTGYSQMDISFEFQAYPTGIIPGVRIEKPHGDKSATHLRIGANIFNHRDLGVQDKEKGAGWGFTVGYKRYFNDSYTKWHLGIKTDIWLNHVEWKNLSGSSPITGETDIRVVQPTLELGYHIDKNDYFITPTIGFGVEWNVKTEGAPTGEGPILLIGIQAGKRF